MSKSLPRFLLLLRSADRRATLTELKRRSAKLNIFYHQVRGSIIRYVLFCEYISEVIDKAQVSFASFTPLEEYSGKDVYKKPMQAIT